ADNQQLATELEFVQRSRERSLSVADVALLRLRENVAILTIGGVNSQELDKLAQIDEAINPSANWNQAARYSAAAALRHIWAEVVPQQLQQGTDLAVQARLGRIVSP